jgi:anthranilate phosphoribosyltransferase
LGKTLDEADIAEFFASTNDLAPTELAALLGCLLGRHDGRDAATVVSAIRRLSPPKRIAGTADSPTVNIVGTGGGPSTFNVSTATSFLLAAAGVKVIKTGSTAWRSRSGFMEVAMALGCLKESLTWDHIEALADETGIAFVPPAQYPSVLRDTASLLTPAIFRRVGYYINIIGPLLSPVAVDFRFLGASSRARQALLVDAATALGDIPACVVAAENGMDEVSSIGDTTVVAIDAAGQCDTMTIDPTMLPLTDVNIEDLAGLNPIGAAKLLKRILSGQGTVQQSEIVALNGATVLWQMGRHDSLAVAFDACLALISAGKPAAKIEALREALVDV